MKILVFPKDTNPYQEYFYKSVKKYGCDYKYLTSPVYSHTVWLLVFLLPQLVINRLSGYKILHMHWLYDFSIPSRSKIFKNSLVDLLLFIYFIKFLILTKLLGYKLVWTIHNILPHNKIFLNDLLAEKVLAKLANAKIVFNTATIEEMKKFGLDTTNTSVIPMGFYNDYYKSIDQRPEMVTDKQNNIIRLLFFGKVERYKGLVEFITALNSLKLSNVRFTIAGECKDSTLEKELIEAAASNVELKMKYFADNDIPVILNQCDIAVFPFSRITNSSSILLAMGYGKPVLFPALEGLSEIPDKAGFKYLANNTDDLKRILMQISKTSKETLQNAGAIGKKYVVDTNSWETIGKKAFEVYKSLEK